MTLPMQISSTGIATARIHVSCTSSRSAMIVPPMTVIGAAMSMRARHLHHVWTWVTSLLTRVMRLGAPKCATSRAREVGDLMEQRAAHVAAEARRRPWSRSRSAMMANTTWNALITSISAPWRQM